MPAVLYVRIKSDLDSDEFDRRLLERRPNFATFGSPWASLDVTKFRAGLLAVHGGRERLGGY